MSEEPLEIDEIIPTIERVKKTLVLQNDKLNTMREELARKEKLIFEREDRLNKAEELSKKLELELQEKEKAISEREERLNQANLQQQQMEFDYLALENEFKKVSQLFNEMSSKEEASLDVKELLSIYITLLEKVFAGQPHAKLLYLLHGDKSEMTRQELTKASGVSAAIVLHSIHELVRAELVTYDEETNSVGLINRIF